MFLDSTTAILSSPIIASRSWRPASILHLGMVVVFNLMIGLLTPPMGLALPRDAPRSE
jgi:TRAP-type C4-dicarboxylate transport system permease large subunit